MAMFTTVAAGVGLATTAVTTGMSFAQARKQRKIQQQAEDDASKMMAEARKKLEVNYYDQLAIQKEPYELEREAIIAAGAQAIEAGKESERGAAAVAGRVQMAQQQGQREIATAMGQEMMGLEKLSAQEDARLRDVGIQLDLSEVEGAQLAAAQAAEAKGLATQQGIQGVTSLMTQGASLIPLYAQDLSAQKKAISGIGFTTEDYKKFGNVADYKNSSLVPVGTEGATKLDLTAVGNMSNAEYRRFVSALTPEQKALLFNNKDFQNKYSSGSQFMNPFYINK